MPVHTHTGWFLADKWKRGWLREKNSRFDKITVKVETYLRSKISWEHKYFLCSAFPSVLYDVLNTKCRFNCSLSGARWLPLHWHFHELIEFDMDRALRFD